MVLYFNLLHVSAFYFYFFADIVTLKEPNQPNTPNVLEKMNHFFKKLTNKNTNLLTNINLENDLISTSIHLLPFQIIIFPKILLESLQFQENFEENFTLLDQEDLRYALCIQISQRIFFKK